MAPRPYIENFRDDPGNCTPPIPWIYLLTAAALEIVWAIGLKYTAGSTRLWPSLLTGIGEPSTVARLACIGLILAGVIGLKITLHKQSSFSASRTLRNAITNSKHYIDSPCG